MDKSPEAFRTISEVAEALETPAHVLRFWESRFPQIRPVKRAGGRRYYRPSDVALLTGIKRLLHEEGLTIRGVQKILREQGVRHVSGLSEEPSAEEIALEAAMAIEVADSDETPAPEPTPEEAAEATAAALEAALGARTAEVVDLAARAATAAAAPEATVPPSPPPPWGAPRTEPVQHELFPLAEAPVPAAAPAEAAAPPAAPEPPVAEAPFIEVEVESPAPPPTPTGPARDLDAGPTLAARLRALPRGSLAPRRDALGGLAARLGEVRARLSGPAAPPPNAP